MSWIDDIGSYLQANGIGTLGTDIFCQGFGKKAPACISLYTQGGPGEDTGASGDYSILYPELGIHVRNMDEETAYQKSTDIRDLLVDVYNTAIGSTYVIYIEAINSEPLFLGQDDNDRFVFSNNFSLAIAGD